MIVATTYENGEVFQHFGHTEHFKIYDVEGGRIVACKVIATNGVGHAELANFLKLRGVDVLICGGLGNCARDALGKARIRIYGGVQGECDKVVQEFVDGRLEYDPSAHCAEDDNCED